MKKIFCYLIISFFSFNAVGAETTPQTELETKPPEKVLLLMPDGSPVDKTVNIKAKLSDVLSQDTRMTGINANKVEIQGLLIPKETTIQGTEFTINWTGATLIDTTKSAIFDEPLATNLRAPSGEIPPATLIPAYGDVEKMSDKIKSLFEEETTKEEEEEPEKKTSSSKSTTPQASSPTTSNDVAENYEALPIEEESVTTYGTTTDGCGVRVDWNTGLVYPQAATTTTKDGVTTKGACTDGEMPFPISYSYSECPNDVVDLTNMKAYATKKPYYTNASGEINYLGECAQSNDDVYIINMSSSKCSPSIDIQAKLVTEQSELYYTNRSGSVITVSPCSVRAEAKTYEIKETTDGCDVSVESDIAYQQTRKVYEKDGVTVAVTSCLNSEKTYNFEWSYTECPNDVIDLEANKAYAMRKQYYKDATGITRYVSDCQKSTDDIYEITENSDGCKIRPDWEKEVAYQQTRKVYEKDGITKTLTSCADSETEYPFEWSYSECLTDIVDLANMKAYATNRVLVSDSEGEIKYLNECSQSEKEEDVYEIVENSDSCDPQIDFENNLVTAKTELIYTNRFGGIMTVSPCSVRAEAKTYEIKETTDGCSFRPDFDKNVAYQQTKKVYEKDGVTTALTSCADSETEYPFVADTSNCKTITDWEKGVVITTAKIRIDTLDGAKYLNDCTPTNTTSNIVETTEGCEAMHNEYWEAGYSRGFSRYYHTLSGSREYLTQCAESSATYTHELEQTGWQNNDTELEADRLMQTYITMPIGKVIIKAASIIDNMPAQPYSYKKTDTVGINEFENSGCNRRELQETCDIYTRPDNTEYTAPGVATAPSAWVDVCTIENEDRYYHKARISGVSHTCSGSRCESPQQNKFRLSCSIVAGFFADKGWCSITYLSGSGGSCVANDAYFLTSRAWEAIRYNQSREKRTNPYTNDVFYSQWTTTSEQKICPSLDVCPATKSKWDNWTSTFNTPEQVWENCSDYVE